MEENLKRLNNVVKLVCENSGDYLIFNQISFEQNPDYSKSFAFDIEFKNSTVQTTLKEIWFYQDDLKEFRK